jgi:perosamine synthetase
MNINYSKQFLDDQDINEVVKSLKNQFLTQGPKINEFEKKIAKYVGSKYAVAVSSCTAGLHIALKAINFEKKDTLLTSTISFVSTSNVAYFMGGKTLFLDIDKNLGISISDLKKKVNKKIKAIIPVHMSGCALNMREIRNISKKYKIPIIEDCAHALGGKYQDKTMVGNCKYSDMSVFSFHPVKSITTGEGGVITTNNKSLYQKLLRLRSHGINKLKDKFENKKLAFTNNKKNFWYYEMTELGYHYRITDFQCALGISQLKKIKKFMSYKNEICKKYDNAFKNLEGVELPHQEFRKYSSNHLYILRINFKKLGITRNELFNYLRSKKIICQVHYIPIVLHPFYQNKGFKIKNYPEAKKYYDECISIPCYYNLSSRDQNFVINNIKFFIHKKYKRNILLIGSTGLLGSYMVSNNKNFKFYAHINKKELENSKIEKVRFKINQKNLRQFILKKKIDIIINCAGLASIEECEKNKHLALELNTSLVKNIISSIKNRDVKVIQISSDHLFKKIKNKITEKTEVKPQNYYALTKAKAEKMLLNSNIDYLIIRTNFFGKGKNGRNSYSDHITNIVKRNERIGIWSNIYFSPLNIKFLKSIIIFMIKKNCHGVFNLSSNEKISKYYFAKKVIKYLKLNTKFIKPKIYVQNKNLKRPTNMSLDNKKIKKIFPQLTKEFSIKHQIQMLK